MHAALSVQPNMIANISGLKLAADKVDGAVVCFTLAPTCPTLAALSAPTARTVGQLEMVSCSALHAGDGRRWGAWPPCMHACMALHPSRGACSVYGQAACAVHEATDGHAQLAET